MRTKKATVHAALLAFVLTAAGCGDGGQGAIGDEAAPADSPGLVDAGPMETAAPPADEVVMEGPATPAGAAATAGSGIVLTVNPTGNEARYRVREVLVGIELPNDAVGRTSAVSGALTIGDGGMVLPGSVIEVNITGLTSDEDRRDGFLQRRVLGGEEFPTVRVTPRELRGVTTPLPTSGSTAAILVGDLTVRDVTRPTNWQVQANFAGDRVTGTATTAFTFEEFGLTKPRVPAVLSVADTIRLEYDFDMAVARP